jgi:hypothetical protein
MGRLLGLSIAVERRDEASEHLPQLDDVPSKMFICLSVHYSNVSRKQEMVVKLHSRSCSDATEPR